MKENIEMHSLSHSKSSLINEYIDGLTKGIPICLGYISVSITFGMMAVRGGMSPGMAVLISMTNLTSAGQFAGLGLIFANATYVELALTTFVINIRYMLMSLSLSQKLDSTIPFLNRCLISFGITDETFTISSLENKELSFQYMLGLITLPYIGWALGTYIGAVTTSFLPMALQDALGIALYSMFIALIIPEMKKSMAVLIVVIISIILSCILRYIPLLSNISSGFAVIIVSIISSCIGAYFFPLKEDK